MDNLSDENLMVLIKKHNQHAFSVLVKRHTSRFYRLAYQTLFSRNEAEDIVQESFLKIWNRPNLWNDAKNTRFTTWFYRIIVNACFDYNRKQQPIAINEKYDIVDDMFDLNTFIMREHQFSVLEQALSQLPQRQRVAINLCFSEGLTNKDAAEIMNIELKALQSLIMRGKTAIKIYVDKNNSLKEDVTNGRQYTC